MLYGIELTRMKVSKQLTNMLFVGPLLLLVSGCGDNVVEPTSQEPDPVLVDIPIAFIKRDLTANEPGQLPLRDLRNTAQFIPGAALYVKVRASATELEVNITDRAFIDQRDPASENEQIPPYDIKDLETSYDGSRLLFAMRAPEIEDADEDEQPSWNIWEYQLATDTLRRIISSDIVAEAGQDTGPVYLPDGRILFSSTRQRNNQAVLLDEGKPQYSGLEEGLDFPASVLHVMDSDGGNITQVSFNQSHDLDPIVLPNGKVLFSRWDQAVSDKGIHLYQMNPDGSELEIVFGRHSHQQNEQRLHFVQSRVTPDNQILVALREMLPARLGGDFVRLDIENFIDIEQPVASNPSGSGQAQTQALFETVDTSVEISPGGYFASLFPLWDGSGRQLFTWSQCRVFEPVEEGQGADSDVPRKVLPCDEELLALPGIEAAAPLFGLWMYDPVENTQLPIGVPVEGVAYTEVVAMEQRDFPANAPQPEEYDASLADEELGVLHIRSVYDLDGVDTSPAGIVNMADPSQVAVDAGPARFMRFVKAVSMPDDEIIDIPGSAFGRSRSQLMREILGYTPIQPDGSVKVVLPANVPIALSILDGNGQRISARHQNWIQVGPGEVKSCNGCHQADSELPHGRPDAENPSVNLGAPSSGLPFPNTNPELAAEISETMAETLARINGTPMLSSDIEFTDLWTDPATNNLRPEVIWRYQQLATALPVSPNCALEWTSLCRAIINYPDHIQPIFERDRLVLDDQGMELADNTCISCHAPTDANAMAQVPAAQLDLTSSPSDQNNDHLTSYRELMFGDNEQEVVEGVLVDRLVIVTDGNGDIVFELDENGEPILDANGDPIPVTRTVRVGNSMSTNGALSSERFFAPFSASHAGWLDPAERKLISEWLDIGGQYYNNPFDIPQD